jgi:hypothetical protein
MFITQRGPAGCSHPLPPLSRILVSKAWTDPHPGLARQSWPMRVVPATFQALFSRDGREEAGLKLADHDPWAHVEAFNIDRWGLNRIRPPVRRDIGCAQQPRYASHHRNVALFVSHHHV